MAVAALPVALKACSVAGATLNCYHLIQKIEEWISTAKENDEVCCDILSNVELIRSILGDLEQARQLTNSVKTAISNLENKLIRCEEYIDLLKDRRLSRVRDFFQSGRIRSDLARLKAAINESLLIMNTAMSAQHLLHAQNVEIASEFDDLNNIPSRPRKPVIKKRAETRVLMTWEEPKQNSSAVAFYQVQYRKRWQRKWSNSESDSRTMLGHIVTGLSTDTKYWFRVRAVTCEDYESLPSEEITVETKLGAVGRRLATTGAFILGTITAPVVCPAAPFINTGLVLRDRITDITEGKEITENDAEVQQVVIASAAGGIIASAVATPLIFAACTIGSPIVGGTAAYYVNKSLQPDDGF